MNVIVEECKKCGVVWSIYAAGQPHPEAGKNRRLSETTLEDAHERIQQRCCPRRLLIDSAALPSESEDNFDNQTDDTESRSPE